MCRTRLMRIRGYTTDENPRIRPAYNAVLLPAKARGTAIEATTNASAVSTSALTLVTPVFPTPATAIIGPQAASNGPAPPE
ncbi:hypothetical protein PtA15_13A173 [Puccinia triticina]|uniref:Uncharacterized protein n=1 Tax=Puccinia triticina TaxID=208348 RepID=A0ABY7D1P1_9BASI|nr:uncharacterized protein PtA15_13A173 [Puccinia triticina]WAQ90774.1 hypothetical protein PtA15_13A173 [Puccinia triticina]